MSPGPSRSAKAGEDAAVGAALKRASLSSAVAGAVYPTTTYLGPFARVFTWHVPSAVAFVTVVLLSKIFTSTWLCTGSVNLVKTGASSADGSTNPHLR